MTQVRSYIIEAHETIIPVVYMASVKRAFTVESPFFGKAMNDAEALDKLAEDEIIKVLRLDTRTWASEDITEECAKIFLADFANRCGDIEAKDEKMFPVFVRTSAAWSRMKDDIEAMAPAVCDDVDAMPSFRRRVYSALQAAE